MKQNTINAVGHKTIVSTAIRQNFKPVLEMNIPAIERDLGLKRKDLY